MISESTVSLLQVLLADVTAMISISTSLLARLRSGEKTEAWTRFVRLYTPVLFYWVRRQGVPSDDTADLVQEVFAILVQKLPTCQRGSQQIGRAFPRNPD